MQTLMCDGCGKQENMNIAEKNRDIQPAKLEFIFDARDTTPKVELTADLCGECRGVVTNRYFRQKEGVILEIPSFLEVSRG